MTRTIHCRSERSSESGTREMNANRKLTLRRSNRRVLGSSLAAAAVLVALSAHAVGTRHFLLDKGPDFKGGDLKGVAVDSAGGVRAGLTLSASPVASAATIWAVLAQRDGSFLIGTGN